MVESQSSRWQPAGRWAITNGRLILSDRVAVGQAVIIEGERILALDDEGALGDMARFDAGGHYVSPGLVDIHTHGALGHTFNEPSDVAFGAITRENARRGVTSLLATVTTGPLADMVQCIEYGEQWMRRQHAGAEVLGIHLEGPYFSLAQRGAQDPANLRTPDDGSADLLLRQPRALRIVTLAPELPGALELTSRLARLGIVAAAGHSDAQDSQVLAALQRGLRHMIHMWSGQSSTVREGPWRRPGLLEATLTFEGFTAEIIADNRHLPPTLMALAYKCLGPDRLCAVSDATNGAGLPEGTRFALGDVECQVEDGVAMLLDGTSFAGSTTLLSQMVPILIKAVGISPVEAIRMASLTPARVIGADDRKGSLAGGKDADLVLFDDSWAVWQTLIRGQWLGIPSDRE